MNEIGKGRESKGERRKSGREKGNEREENRKEKGKNEGIRKWEGGRVGKEIKCQLSTPLENYNFK